MEIAIGKGEIWISNIQQGERKGLLLRPTGVEHEIDSKDPEFDKLQDMGVTDKDVVIWLDSLAGARVLQDAVNGACLRLNRYEIKDRGL